jgi:hypothetical protein
MEMFEEEEGKWTQWVEKCECCLPRMGKHTDLWRMVETCDKLTFNRASIGIMDGHHELQCHRPFYHTFVGIPLPPSRWPSCLMCHG